MYYMMLKFPFLYVGLRKKNCSAKNRKLLDQSTPGGYFLFMQIKLYVDRTLNPDKFLHTSATSRTRREKNYKKNSYYNFKHY